MELKSDKVVTDISSVSLIAFISGDIDLVYIDIFKTEETVRKVKWAITSYSLLPGRHFSVIGKKFGPEEELRNTLKDIYETFKDNYSHGKWYKKTKLLTSFIDSFCG